MLPGAAPRVSVSRRAPAGGEGENDARGDPAQWPHTGDGDDGGRNVLADDEHTAGGF